MKAISAMALIFFIAAANVASLQERIVQIQFVQAADQQMCAQVISCGTKNGERKEYPTPCAARNDGATDIAPKTGPTC